MAFFRFSKRIIWINHWIGQNDVWNMRTLLVYVKYYLMCIEISVDGIAFVYCISPHFFFHFSISFFHFQFFFIILALISAKYVETTVDTTTILVFGHFIHWDNGPFMSNIGRFSAPLCIVLSTSYLHRNRTVVATH